MERHCTLTFEAWLKLHMHFDCTYLEISNACILKLNIALNTRDGMESKYPSIVFLSIHFWEDKSNLVNINNVLSLHFILHGANFNFNGCTRQHPLVDIYFEEM